MRLRTLLVGAAAAAAAAGCSSTTHTTHGPTTRPATPTTPTTPAAPSSTATTEPGGWTTYAGGNLRLGVAPAQPALAHIHMVWSAPADGAAVYAQPLIAGGRVYAVTEEDNVYALDARTGAVKWKAAIGSPLHNVVSAAGCGNIDPLGITSTPVIDTATGTLYTVGEVADGQSVHHELVGLSTTTGAVRMRMDVDPPLPAGEVPVHLLQRESLALYRGRLYVGYGGNYGDCGTYHGWVVEVDLAHGTTASFNVTPHSTGGAIWQGGGAPAIDDAGNLYLTTGNPTASGSSPYGEAAVKLSPTLQPEAAFQDPAATDDLDLTTGDTALLPDGTLVAVGKTDVAYWLRQSDLTRVAAIRGQVCGSDPDGGQAYDQATNSVYVPCRQGGIQQIDLSTRTVGWKAGQANSTPILVNGDLWAVSYPDGNLQELDPRSGSVMQQVSVGRTVPHFASPAAAGGLLVLGTTRGVVAFGA